MSRLFTIAVATLCLVCAGLASAVAENPSLWHHNGSLFTLSPDGSRLVLRYHEPREGMRVEGVTRGTILFEVVRSGNVLSGTAYVFSRRCGRIPYRVTGEILPDGRRMALNGNPPTALDTHCNPTAVRDDVAQFDLRQGIMPPAQEAQAKVTSPSEQQWPSAEQPASPDAAPDSAAAERLKNLLDRTAEPPPAPTASMDGEGFAHTWRPDPAVTARLEQFEREQRQRQEQQTPMTVPAPTVVQQPIASPVAPLSSAFRFFKDSAALFWTAVASAVASVLVLIAFGIRRSGEHSRQPRQPRMKLPP